MLPELGDLPPGLVLDGELVAFNSEGDPHFPALSQRVLHGDRTIGSHLMIFDLLHVDGTSLLNLTYADRRAQLESLGLEDAHGLPPGTFDDGPALYEAVCERGLEGIVANAPLALPSRQARVGQGEKSGLLATRERAWRDEEIPSRGTRELAP